jgi:hypothetical protein
VSEWFREFKQTIKCMFTYCREDTETLPAAEESKRLVNELNERIEHMILDEGVDRSWLERAVMNQLAAMEEERRDAGN